VRPIPPPPPWDGGGGSIERGRRERFWSALDGRRGADQPWLAGEHALHPGDLPVLGVDDGLGPSQINKPVLEGLAFAVAAVSEFSVVFDTTAWFGTEVLWLAPSPADPFVALSAAVAAAFPAYPPYGGAHARWSRT
jgi:hypothetical protein